VATVSSRNIQEVNLELDQDNSESLFQQISDRGELLYGPEGRKVWEELALSTASYGLFRTFGRQVEGVRILRHPLIFGQSGAIKSNMVKEFRKQVLPNAIKDTRIDLSSDAATVGGWDGEQNEPIRPKVMRYNFCQVEWDTLSTGDSERKMGIFLKALEEGIISRDLMQIARSANEMEEEELQDLADVQISGTQIQFPVRSSIVGVVHNGSTFWEKFEDAFYRRWFPVYVDHPQRFDGKPLKMYIRENSHHLDDDTSELKTEMHNRLVQNELQSDGFIADPQEPKPLYGEDVDELLRIGPEFEESNELEFRISNSMKVTLAAKALLENQIEDGQLYYTEDDYRWLLERIENQYQRDLYEIRTRAVSKNDNLGAIKKSWQRYTNTEKTLELIYDNDGISRRQLAEELEIPESTVKNYLANEWAQRLTRKKREQVEGREGLVTLWYPVDQE
jgi:hypothetical protein